MNIRIFKSEIRISKSETNPKFKITMSKTFKKNKLNGAASPKGQVLNFIFWSFEFVSDFVLRASNFIFYNLRNGMIEAI
jgi:hypothetical protein